jgi:hypothetical protein
MNVWQRVFDFLVSHLDFFARTFGKAGAIAYLGELAVHVLVLTTSFRLVDLPGWADWAFVILGGYCALLMWVFRTSMAPRFGDPEVRVVTTLFVTVSALIHLYFIIVQSHEALGIFGRGFSYVGVAYSLFLVLRLGTLETKITVRKVRPPVLAAAAGTS